MTMADATPEQRDLARKIAADRPGLNSLQRQAILDGRWDDIDGIRCALAAIIETTERIERLLDRCNDPCPQCHDALRNQEHLKND